MKEIGLMTRDMVLASSIGRMVIHLMENGQMEGDVARASYILLSMEQRKCTSRNGRR